MANEHPQLVFLGGPDGGRRILLDRLPVRLGRSAECGIRVAETFASREQAEFGHSPEGVVLENLSSRGTEIGGKTYKRGKPVLLATGDIIKLGVETEILFVAGGDDPAAALSALQAQRQAEMDERRSAEAQRQRQEEERKQRKKKKAPEPPKEAPDEPAASPKPAGAPDLRTDSAKVADLAAAERKKRSRKILIGLGAYMGVIVLVGVALSLRSGKATHANLPPQLSRAQIEEGLERHEEGFVNSQQAAVALAKARDRYDRRNIADHYLWESVVAYREYLTCSGRSSFEAESDARKYDSEMEELKKNVIARYDEGSRAMQQERWDAATKAFEAVRGLVPDPQNPVYANATGQVNYCHIQQKAKVKRGPF